MAENSETIGIFAAKDYRRAFEHALRHYEPYRTVKNPTHDSLHLLLKGAISLGFFDAAGLAQTYKEPVGVVEKWVEGVELPETKVRKKLVREMKSILSAGPE